MHMTVSHGLGKNQWKVENRAIENAGGKVLECYLICDGHRCLLLEDGFEAENG